MYPSRGGLFASRVRSRGHEQDTRSVYAVRLEVRGFERRASRGRGRGRETLEGIHGCARGREIVVVHIVRL